MIFATSTNPVGVVASIASSVMGDWSAPIIMICGILFAVMIIGILVKSAGGEHTDFGLDDDELNPLE